MGPTRLASPSERKKRKRSRADVQPRQQGQGRDLAEFDSDVSSGEEGDAGHVAERRGTDEAELGDTPEDTVPAKGSRQASEGNESEEEDLPMAKKEKEAPDDYATAFAKIMYRRIAPNAPGPILAANQSLLASKLAEEAAQTKASSAARQEKREEREKNHVLPESHTDAYERTLIKVATKGVVRLFNAVSKAQKGSLEAGPTKADKGHISSAALVAELRGAVTKAPAGPHLRSTDSGAGVPARQPAARGASGVQTWGVLEDKFDLGRTGMKHWDAQDGGGSDEGGEGLGSDDDDDDD